MARTKVTAKKNKTSLTYRRKVKVAQKAPRAQVKKPHRYKPGTRALMDIKKWQRSTSLILDHKPFANLLKKVAHEKKIDIPKYGANVPVCIQDITESVLVDILEGAQLNAFHAKRITVMPKDISLIQGSCQYAHCKKRRSIV